MEIANTLGAAFEKSSPSNNYSKEFQSIKAQKEKQKINFKTNKNLRYNKKFTMRDLKRSLKKSNNSSPGPDQIHYEILHHLPIETLHILLDIINETWKSDTFPESWRVALIISIPKPGKDNFNPLNYRPIALTSCICKTVERMVNERLVWYLEKNGLLAKQQCGYRANRSTVDHLVRLETFIRDAFIQNQHLVAVFFDLQKAYDATWKCGILQDLYDMGLRGNLPIFIGKFLSDRTFQVHLGTILSDEIFHQEEGVPQGAILSTTLFNVKINNIVKQVDPGVECSLYVDDFVIMYKSPTIDAIQRKLQYTINRLEKWTLQNGFTISKNKTVDMHFCPDKKCMDPVLKLDNDPIQFVKEAKFLGLIWDSKLTFEPHIKYLKAWCQKSLNVLKVLSRTEWGADQATLLKLYRSLVRSKLDYGCIVYGSASKTALAKLDPVHNQGLRLSLGEFRSPPVSRELRGETISAFRRSQAKARRLFNQKKRQSWAEYVSKLSAETPIKHVWDRVREISGKNICPPKQFLNGKNGTTITDPKDIANEHAAVFTDNSSSAHYSATFQAIKEQEEKVKIDFTSDNTEVYNKPFRLRDLRRSIIKAKPRAPGPDGIHNNLLKHLPDDTLNILKEILNKIWIAADFPQQWRAATVIPIPKPNKDHTDPLSYRPIALTSCLCKVLERMINTRFIWYLEKYRILDRNQCGDRKHRSTTDHLVSLERYLRDAFAQKQQAVGLFFDLEKACFCVRISQRPANPSQNWDNTL